MGIPERLCELLISDSRASCVNRDLRPSLAAPFDSSVGTRLPLTRAHGYGFFNVSSS